MIFGSRVVSFPSSYNSHSLRAFGDSLPDQSVHGTTSTSIASADHVL